ncbi:MAG: hypothetical protein K8S27_03960 [Candidatus Omnitrophica bacterium]|nr:hypothetical protein [Candidatus Omnitrophota bacterium]
MLSLSWKESACEELEAAIFSKNVAIKDCYALSRMTEFGFDSYDKEFIKLFKRKIVDEGYKGDYKKEFGISANNFSILCEQIDGLRGLVIRSGEEFDLDKVLQRFNKIFGDKMFR